MLSSSSAELSANSGQMSDGSRQASDKAHAVAAAAEQMTANVVSVAAGMEQTTTNLASVASATEQMTATIGEIAGNSEKARRITEEATRQAARISEQMNQLGAGGAARSARSPKPSPRFPRRPTCWRSTPPSRRPAPARPARDSPWWPTRSRNWPSRPPPPPKTSRAGSRACRSSTAGGIAEIEKVSQVIHEVSDIVSSIAAAIEEQATVTKDIAREYRARRRPACGTPTSAWRRASQATAEIAKEIAGVDQAAGQMAEGSEQVQASATELSRVAEQLQATVQPVSRSEVGGRPCRRRLVHGIRPGRRSAGDLFRARRAVRTGCRRGPGGDPRWGR